MTYLICNGVNFWYLGLKIEYDASNVYVTSIININNNKKKKSRKPSAIICFYNKHFKGYR